MKKYFFYTLFTCLFISNSFGQVKHIEEGRSFGKAQESNLNFERKHTTTSQKQIDYTPIQLEALNYNPKQFKVLSKDKDGKALYISGSLKTRKTYTSLDEEVDDYIQSVRSIMALNNENVGFKIIDISHDKIGQTHIRMQQYCNQIPIYGKQIILHKKEDAIYLLNGDYQNKHTDNLHTSSQIDIEKAKDLVINKISNHKHLDEEKISSDFKVDFKRSQETLVYYPYQSELKLAWHITYYPHLGERMEYFVDAVSGNILKEYSSLCKLHKHSEDNLPPDGPATANATDLLGQVRTINTYEFSNKFYMIDASRSMFQSVNSDLPDNPLGAIWTIDAFNTAPQNNNFEIDHVTNNFNQWGSNAVAVSAQFNAGEAYEYFIEKHTRNGISGTGDNIVSVVNVAGEDGNSMGNAYWNGFAIFYGNGDSNFFPLGRALDVAGHEMSHGVVQNTANLEYFGESGAMNESFADIFGAMIDDDDWTIGEDVVKASAFPSGALRSLQDPHNGAATGDFGRGWQPKHVDEKFTGPQDNNGVHINSGIPNHAFYRFATTVGNTKAEQVFYRALDVYLTKSSQFIDLRNAVLQSAQDLYGNTEVQAAANAFNAVGIGEGQGTNTQQDVDLNPGTDLILFSSEGRDSLFIINNQGEEIASPLSVIDHISRPSVTDDGTIIVFVGSDKKMYAITIDWANSTASQQEIESNPMWRNVVISKQGNRVAAVTDNLNNKIVVFDLDNNGERVDFELYNPTFSEGVATGEVAFADAMEFDYTGQYILYDAKSIVRNSAGEDIEYWDIGFLQVWNSASDTWSLGNISKLFTALPENISVGNPTYSKNSPFIIAFDFISPDENSILGVNSETGDVELIRGDNSGLGYPSYSRDDRFIVYDVPFIQNGSLAGYDYGGSALNDNKISANTASHQILETFARWPIWFSNGERILSDVVDLGDGEREIKIYPNPVDQRLNIYSERFEDLTIQINDLAGKKVFSGKLTDQNQELDISALNAGIYFIHFISKGKQHTMKFIKV